MEAKSIYLFFTEGSSDKVYNIHLRERDGGWVVDYENAGRGRPLRSGTKTAQPLSYDDALKEYNRVLKVQQKKGYTEDESGVVYAGTDRAGDVTGFQPQLLVEIDGEAAVSLLMTGDWLIQEKHDGERRGAAYDTEIVFSNKSGLRTGAAQTIVDDLQAYAIPTGDFEFDGEDLGTNYIIFDVLKFRGQDLRDLPFSLRAKTLSELDNLFSECASIAVDTPMDLRDEAEIRAYIASLREAKAEGVVIRQKSARYVPGLATYATAQAYKLKFWKDATLRVAYVHPTKRSIAIEALDGEVWVKMGNCTIPSNTDIPTAGDLVDIKYLNCRRGGSLYQPQFMRLRTDVKVTEATVDRIVFD